MGFYGQKVFLNSQQEVLVAYRRVMTNRVAGGIDRIDIEKFEVNLSDKLYKLWNSLSFGTLFQKPLDVLI